ncbi:peptidyl-prolyl cis-trans isomerase CYP95 [Neltuma alba]|uniref:peptidyl-prolyl cis-trans isomerase CYP95 n=1 Tax=Neltuma alba TaxID=207710 RepID=UPI0010A44DD2|nr:peptidyl-prolyl cis-trans isomerase CYP95-like [Prosopis alba]
MEAKNPQVFMDVSVDKVHAGTMVFELFKDVAPATVENFRALCTGEKGKGPIQRLPLHYKGSFFYQIWRGSSYIKGGDFFSSRGTCGESIYGADFPDENPELECDARGLLCMDICDRLGIGSHFVITKKPDRRLKRFHVVFGKLARGIETLDKITEARLGSSVQVTNCGECNEDDIETGEEPGTKRARRE